MLDQKLHHLHWALALFSLHIVIAEELQFMKTGLSQASQTIADRGRPSPIVADHCRSWQTIADRGRPLPIVADHCRSWQTIADRGRPLPIVADHCRSWQTIADRGRPLPIVADHCRSWQTIAYGFPRIIFILILNLLVMICDA